VQGVGCRDGGAWLDLLECRSRSSLTYEMGFVLPAQRKPKSISHTPPAARDPPLNGVQPFGGALRLCVKWRRVEAVRLRAICPDAIKSVQTPTGFCHPPSFGAALFGLRSGNGCGWVTCQHLP
jgi:hypothetical protein